MSDFEKAQKNLRNDLIVIFVLELLLTILFLIYSGDVNIFTIVFVVLSFIGIFLAKAGSRGAGIIGIIFGILMLITILSGDIIDFMLGLFLLIHSIKYNKLSKK